MSSRREREREHLIRLLRFPIDQLPTTMGVFTFVCKSSGSEWTAKQLTGDLEASAGSTFDLQRKLVNAALSSDSSGGVQSSFSMVSPSSAVFQVTDATTSFVFIIIFGYCLDSKKISWFLWNFVSDLFKSVLFMYMHAFEFITLNYVCIFNAFRFDIALQFLLWLTYVCLSDLAPLRYPVLPISLSEVHVVRRKR